MEQNIVVSVFEVESEAYQALTLLKQNPGNEKSFVLQAVLVKKENGTLKVLDAFDTGASTNNDTMIGGIIGGLFGILGGPIGVLLMSSYGALVGNLFDTDDALNNASLIEQIAGKLDDNTVAIIALASEEDEAILDSHFTPYKTVIARFDAATIAVEVEEAEEMAEEMARQARQKLRDEKKSELKLRIEEKKAEIKNDWENFISNAEDN